MIDFSLSKEQESLREEIIAFSEETLTPGALDRDKAQFFDRSLWEACGQLKLPGMLVKKEYGGRGLDAVSTVVALEALGYGSADSGLNFSLAAHLLACVVPIQLFGSEEQKNYFLPALSDGRWIAANAMTEASSGSDAFNMEAAAVKGPEGYILNGHKNFCSNGPVADVVLAYFTTTPGKGFFGGISAFLLEKGKQDFFASEKVEKFGVRTCQMGEFRFTDTLIGGQGLLGKEGAGGMIFNTSMEWERICLGALHLGAMEKQLEKAISFARTRKSGGKSIASNQAVSHPLANLKIQIESARLLTLKAAWKLDAGKPAGMDAAMAKVQLSETFRSFATQLMQLYAGKAYREEHEAQQLLRDAVGDSLYSGTTEVLRNILATHMRLK
ncbi:MAG: acyl-CoA dehydrogenase [Bacteroidetes bacterium]|nr:acyl-CoA dehydrogenase [Bacteroidota bacterium]